MAHDVPLITTMAMGLALAYLLGLLAHRLKLPLIAGYLAAGVVIGPFTPGFVADQKLATELAEIGIILLMFGVGMHFSLRELMQVRRIAVPGAVGQVAVAVVFGAGLGWILGWGIGAALIFGLALSVASTVVLLRALQDRGIVAEGPGRIAVGWLIVEDLVMVLALVLIPPLAGVLGGQAQPPDPDLAVVVNWGIGAVWATLFVTLAKVAAFVVLMLVAGTRIIPWLLDYTAQTGERELFRLSVLAIALGVALAAANIFGVSFALGAFFAGMVMAGSTLSAQAMKDTLPLRDAFAVLFFVSVGMLFDPAVLWEAPFSVLVTVLIIIGVKSAVAFGIVRAFGHPKQTALTVAASLAQIGEFSFIVIVMGEQMGIVPTEARDLVVAGAIASILLNPLVFRALLGPRGPRKAGVTPSTAPQASVAPTPASPAP